MSQHSSAKTSALEALTQLAAKLDDVIRASPASELERNAKQTLIARFAKLGFVTREQYDIQVALLEKNRAKLTELEKQLAALVEKGARL